MCGDEEVERVQVSGGLLEHLNECDGCEPLFRNTVVLHREGGGVTRLLLETVAIKNHPGCVSKPSVDVSNLVAKTISEY